MKMTIFYITEHLGFDTLQMAAIPNMHFDSRECDVTWQRPIQLHIGKNVNTQKYQKKKKANKAT